MGKAPGDERPSERMRKCHRVVTMTQEALKITKGDKDGVATRSQEKDMLILDNWIHLFLFSIFI